MTLGTVRVSRASIFSALALTAMLPIAGCHRHRHDTHLSDNMQKVVASPQLAIMKWTNYSDYQQQVKAFYDGRDYALAWTDDGVPTAQATAMLEAFANAAQKGLKPEDYDASRWQQRVARVRQIHDSHDDSANSQDVVAQFDAALTISAMRFVSDLHSGRVNPQQLNFDIDVPSKRAAFSLTDFLSQKLVEADDVPSALLSVEPQNPMYAQMERMLPHYLQLAQEQQQMSPQPLPPVAKTLNVNGNYAGMGALLTRLQLEGYVSGLAPQPVTPAPPPSSPPSPAPQPGANGKHFLTKKLEQFKQKHSGTSSSGNQTAATPSAPPWPVSRIYTQQVSDAVKMYQSQHGLTPDGTLTQETIDSLNVPLSMRVDQIEDSLERWRWLPDEYVQPRVLENLAEFIVRAYEPDHTLAFKMKTVNGEADGHETPVFVRHMRYVIFRPYWNLPVSIVKKELMRHVNSGGAAYLEKNEYEVTDRAGNVVTGWKPDDLEHSRYDVRQKPGPKNSLGLVKFMFPNEYDIYMHSTPEINLFNLTRRDRSHGCVRLNDAEKMADWVLNGQGDWDADKIHTAMFGPADGGEPANNKQANLKTPLTVDILYLTANADEDGTMHFFDDIYGYDKDMDAILAKGMPYPSAAAKVNPKVAPGETE